MLETAAANAAVIDHIGGMEPEESIPLAPGAAAARARDALQMGQAAPTPRPPGSAAALAREALQQAAPPGAAAALAREALQQRAAPPGAAAASARDLLQKPRPPPSAPPLPTLPPLQQHWQPPEIIDFEDDDEEEVGEDGEGGDRAGATVPARIGRCKSVVTAARGDDTLGSLRIGHDQHGIGRTPDLERACDLEVLTLQKDT